MQFIQNVKNESISEAHLRKLGLKSTEEINDWFRKSYDNGYWIKPMESIINLLNEFKEKTVYVLGDYDVDGISATSIMILGLSWAGFKGVKYKIPNRNDGFGVSIKIIEEINSEIKTKSISPEDVLLITVDNGIAGIEPVQYAKELGFKVIVTDHHEPTVIDNKIVLPNADIIFDANAVENSAEFNGYCGAANAYKIMFELLGDDNRKNLLTPIAMFATFCDQMELVEENYVIAYKGLKMANEQMDFCLPAIRALAQVFGIVHWTSTSVGFSIGPAINALERVEDGAAKYGVQLLTCSDYETCLELAIKLKGYNDDRKIMTEEAYRKADAMIKSENENLNQIAYPIILNVPDVRIGILGILAGKILEKYNLPVGVFSKADDGTLKGSFRSPGTYNIKEHLDECSEEFIAYGGHAPAAGASVSEDNFENMKRIMQETAKPNVAPKDQDVLYYDVEISNNDLIQAIQENEKFQPLGNGNEDLIFKITDFDVIPDFGGYKKPMRNNGVRLKSISSVAVGFGKMDKAKDINGPCTITLYGTIANNYWKKQNGEVIVSQQIQFEELEIQEEENKLTPFAKALREKALKRNQN